MAKKLVITGGGATYELHDVNWTLGELAAVQRHTGLKAVEFENGIQDPTGNVLALLGAMWIAARRGGDVVSWEDFEARQDVAVTDISVDLVDVPDPTDPPAAEPNRAERRAAAPSKKSAAKTAAGK